MPDDGDHYPWYQIVEGDKLEQGDILQAFDVLVPQANFEAGIDDYSAELQTFDIVVMTQSCDISRGQRGACFSVPCSDSGISWMPPKRAMKTGGARSEKSSDRATSPVTICWMISRKTVLNAR